MLRAIQDGGPADSVPQDAGIRAPEPGPSGAAATAEFAALLRAQVGQCDDLYPIARKYPAARLQRETLPQGQIPKDIALALAAMDLRESRVMSRAGR